MSALVQAYNRGYRAGMEEMVEHHDDQFWLRTYAGQAMQGILASDAEFERDDYDKTVDLIAATAVEQAQALLTEIKKAEAQDE